VVWALVALGLGCGAAAVIRRRRSTAAWSASPEAGVRELEQALPRLGWSLPAGTTLLALERRLRRAAGPASGGYVSLLRASRFSPAGGRLPGRADRRELRRELTRAGGFASRLRGFVALPPW
jgi:hypothetical protein